MKDKFEEDVIARLIGHLNAARGGAFEVTGRDVPVPSGENFDYRIESAGAQPLAVEIYRLAEGEELAALAMWRKVIDSLKKELERRNLSGYIVSAPRQFTLRKAEFAAAVKELADEVATAIETHRDEAKIEQGRWTIQKAEGVTGIAFIGVGEAKAVDPRGTTATAFTAKLQKKNSQLNVADHERILLVVNWVMFVDADDVIRVLSQQNPQGIPNIDKIIFEARPGEFAVVFDRRVIEFEKRGELPSTAGERTLLTQQIRHRLLEHDGDAFTFVREMTERLGSIAWLDDAQARENLVEIGEQFVSDDRVDDALWIVRALKDDPDPDLSSRYHREVAEGKNPGIITSVRGRLCWLIAKIIGTNRSEYYRELLDIVEGYLGAENLYIRVQAAVPLDAFMRRRKAERNHDGTGFTWSQSERVRTKELALRALRENAGLWVVVQALLRVFDAPRDFTEGEAAEIIKIALATNAGDVLHDVAHQIIYYALFREREPAAPKFDSSQFLAILRNQIRHGAPALKSSLMWHFWKIIEQNHLPYADIWEFIDLALAEPFAPGADRYLDLIIPELAKRDAAEARRLASIELERVEAYLEAGGRGDIWIAWTNDVLPLYADHPDELVSLVEALARLWHRGLFVGDPLAIALSYQVIRDPERRRELESQFRAMHAEMRNAQPRLPELPSP